MGIKLLRLTSNYNPIDLANLEFTRHEKYRLFKNKYRDNKTIAILF